MNLDWLLEEWSINRNIVECKEIICYFLYFPNTVLIETLWNVKLIKGILEPVIGEQVLIETLWNVKSELKNI